MLVRPLPMTWYIKSDSGALDCTLILQFYPICYIMPCRFCIRDLLAVTMKNPFLEAAWVHQFYSSWLQCILRDARVTEMALLWLKLLEECRIRDTGKFPERVL